MDTLESIALAIQRIGGTDHLDFDHVDLQQAAAIVATFVYHTAMRDEMLPRVALPKPPQF